MMSIEERDHKYRTLEIFDYQLSTFGWVGDFKFLINDNLVVV